MAYQGPSGYPGQGQPGYGQGQPGYPQGPGYSDQTQVPPQGYPGQAPQGYPGQAQPGYPAQQPGYQNQPQGYGQAPGGYAVNPSMYADWGTRVGAYLIDAAPIIAGWIVFAILSVIVHNGFFSLFLYFILFVGSIGWSVYNRWILGGAGQTFGKQKLNIKLISEETGQPIGTGQAFLRDLCHVLDGFFCIGYLFPLWDEKRQTFADKILRTVVVPANQ
ncbi:MAG TPA: RDD family protein [Streptosporangiaceae bacterium]|nr:RDD family protein [Streptosporangiaceae bacterium]